MSQTPVQEEAGEVAYNWAQLGFVEKWRLHAVRGHLVGLYRPEDRTFYDLRLDPSEGGARRLAGAVDVHLLDPGDIIREKRLGLLQRVTVILSIVPSSPARASGPEAVTPAAARGRPQRWLEPGSQVAGTVIQVEGDTALMDIGIPVLVRLPEGEGGQLFQPDHWVEFTVSETPKGFLVV